MHIICVTGCLQTLLHKSPVVIHFLRSL